MDWHQRISRFTERTSVEFKAAAARKRLNEALQKLGEATFDHFTWYVPGEEVPDRLRDALVDAQERTKELADVENYLNKLSVGALDPPHAPIHSPPAQVATPPTGINNINSPVDDKTVTTAQPLKDGQCCTAYINKLDYRFCGICGQDLEVLRKKQNPDVSSLDACCESYLMDSSTRFCGVCGKDLRAVRMEQQVLSGKQLGLCCQAALGKGQAFCPGCGKNLTGLDSQTLTEQATRTCPFCLQPVSYEHTECPHCGRNM